MKEWEQKQLLADDADGEKWSFTNLQRGGAALWAVRHTLRSSSDMSQRHTLENQCVLSVKGYVQIKSFFSWVPKSLKG